MAELTLRAKLLERLLQAITGQSNATLFATGYAFSMDEHETTAEAPAFADGMVDGPPADLNAVTISFYPESWDKLKRLSHDGTVLGFLVSAGVLAENFADKHAEGYTEIILRNPKTGEAVKVDGGLPYKVERK